MQVVNDTREIINIQEIDHKKMMFDVCVITSRDCDTSNIFPTGTEKLNILVGKDVDKDSPNPIIKVFRGR